MARIRCADSSPRAIPHHLHFRIGVNTQMPLLVLHASVVHGLLSSQVAVVMAHAQPVVGSQLSVVHALLSSQLSAVSLHLPALHALPLVHALPSVPSIALPPAAP